MVGNVSGSGRLRRLAIALALLLVLAGAFLLLQFLTAVRLGSVLPAEGSSLRDGSVEIMAGVAGFEPGDGRVRVVLDGTELASDQVKLLPGSVRVASQLDDGTHRVEVEVQTPNLFARRLVRAWSFVVDSRPPAMDVLVPEPGSAISARETRFRARFDESVEAVLMVDGRQVLTAEGTELMGELSLDEGVHRFALRARDGAGNVALEEWEAAADFSAPTLVLDPAPTGEWTEAPEHIHLAVSDNSADKPRVTAQLDGQALEVQEEATAGEAGADGRITWSFAINTAGLKEGEHRFDVEAADAAGNRATAASTVKLDVRKIRIDISERRLYHYEKGTGVTTYPVAVGLPQYPTPRGTYRIVVKEKDPTWNPPPSPWAEGLEPVPPGPGNPLGTRWIGLSAYAIGIHGTYVRSSIGTAASHGCIRMHIKDVEELFERVHVGMPVEIVS